MLACLTKLGDIVSFAKETALLKSLEIAVASRQEPNLITEQNDNCLQNSEKQRVLQTHRLTHQITHMMPLAPHNQLYKYKPHT